MDLTTLTDAEFAAHHAAVRAESERRDALARIPEQVADLRAKYEECGGDPAAI